MNEYLLNPEVCPSSLNENDEPSTPGETAHKWDEETGLCNECGTQGTPNMIKHICECGNEHEIQDGFKVV